MWLNSQKKLVKGHVEDLTLLWLVAQVVWYSISQCPLIVILLLEYFDAAISNLKIVISYLYVEF